MVDESFSQLNQSRSAGTTSRKSVGTGTSHIGQPRELLGKCQEVRTKYRGYSLSKYSKRQCLGTLSSNSDHLSILQLERRAILDEVCLNDRLLSFSNSSDQPRVLSTLPREGIQPILCCWRIHPCKHRYRFRVNPRHGNGIRQ